MVSLGSPLRMLNLLNDTDILLLAYLQILPFTCSIHSFDNSNKTHTFFLYNNPVNLMGINQLVLYTVESYAELVIFKGFATLGCNKLNYLFIHTSSYTGLLKLLRHYTDYCVVSSQWFVSVSYLFFIENFSG